MSNVNVEADGVNEQTPAQANLDEADQRILADRQAKREMISGVRPGDWCILPDGSARRFADSGYSLESKPGEGGPGSFYLRDDGSVSYSGGLYRIGTVKDSTVYRPQLRQESQKRPGTFWFFHHDYRAADNAADVSLPCRVFAVVLPRP